MKEIVCPISVLKTAALILKKYHDEKKRIISSPTEPKEGDYMYREVRFYLQIHIETMKLCPTFRVFIAKNRRLENQINNGRYYILNKFYECSYYISFDANELARFVIETGVDLHNYYETNKFFATYCKYLYNRIMEINPKSNYTKRSFRIDPKNSREEAEKIMINCISRYMQTTSKKMKKQYIVSNIFNPKKSKTYCLI